MDTWKSRLNIQKQLNYLYAPMIVMLILTAVYIIKGVFPFGSNTIDVYDMGQMNAPMYYHLYDALHGTKPLFYDWYSGLGINMSETVSICSLLSPFNIFFYFVSRDGILQSLSLFTMIKMMAMAATMYLFLDKKFRVCLFWKVMFAVNYALCGFSLQYYSNNQWLDIAAVFPLLLLSLVYLFEKNRAVPYIAVLSLCMIINFYISAILLMFLFFLSGLYFLIFKDTADKSRKILSLGIGTAAAVGISSFIWLPAVIQILGSIRTSAKTNVVNQYISILEKKNGTVNAQVEKWWMLLGTALAFALIVKGIAQDRKNKKINLFIIGCVLLVTLQLFFENINLLWHGGSYIGFPVRYGFIISFVLLSAGCYYVSRDSVLNGISIQKTNLSLREKSLNIIIWFCLFITLTSTLWNIFSSVNTKQKIEIFKLSIILFIFLIVSFLVLITKLKNIINYRWISVLVISELFLCSYLFILPSWRAQIKEQSSGYIRTATELKNDLDIYSSDLDRIKNIGNTLNSNYPFILQRSALSNWTHTITKELQDHMKNLGYSVRYTRLVDSGGTAFTDALIHVNQTLSPHELDSSLYSYTGKSNTYRLYNNKYVLPFGIPTSDTITSLHYQNKSRFEYQNSIYEALYGQKDLFCIVKTSDNQVRKAESLNDDIQLLTYNMSIQGDQALYIDVQANDKQNMTFSIGDKVLPIPSIGQDKNNVYPALFNNNILLAGTFSNETVTLKVKCPADFNADLIELGLMDLAKLEGFINSYSKYDENIEIVNSKVFLNVTGDETRNMLFLPIAYDKGWSCKVNGRNVPVERAIDSFIGVRLNNGTNNIQLTFSPCGMKTGALVSVVSILVVILMIIINKKKPVVIPELLLGIIGSAFYAVWYFAVTFVYIIPVFYTLFQNLIRKCGS